MLREGIIEESSSPYSFPLLVVPKKNGKKRVVVDFRALNEATIRNSYPLPHIHHILDQLKDANYVSSLDLLSGFLQIPLDPESKQYCAFSLKNNHYQYCRMPFGLHSSPATFQAIMNRVLKSVIYKFAYVYLDDVLVVSKTFEQHLQHLEEVFQLLFEAGFKINWEKSHLGFPEIEYLGFVVGGGNIKVSSSKTEAIESFPTPRSCKQLRSFLGLANWYRRFIPDMATISAPLTKLLHKDVPFVWTNEHEEAISAIKQCLIEAPKLYCPDFNKQFEIWSDCSDVGIGGVILQRDEKGAENVVAFTSRVLNKAERNYSVTERECLAIIHCLETFRPYIDSVHCKVMTDHASLTWLWNIKQPTGRIARWIVRLSQFDISIEHRKGKLMTVPDTLSRAPYNLCATDIKQGFPDFPQIKDEWYLQLKKNIISNPVAYRQFFIDGDYVFKRVLDPFLNTVTDKLYVPYDLRHRLLQSNHDSMTGGHLGFKKTFFKISRLYYWPSLKQDVREYVSSCQDCQRGKPTNQLPIGTMNIDRDTNLQPWQIVSLDFVGSLPRTPRQNQYIIVFEDVCTKFLVARAVRQATAQAAVKVLMEDIVLEHGRPSVILVDNASQFNSRYFRENCDSLNIKVHFTPKYCPQSNEVERYNRTLKQCLAIYAKDNHTSWDVHLKFVLFALRTAVSEVTGFTPAKLVFGRELRGIQELFDPVHRTRHGEFDPSKYNLTLQAELAIIHSRVEKAVKRAKLAQGHHYNLRHRKVNFEIGDLVFRKNFPHSSKIDHIAAKLSPRFVGPFKIVEKLSTDQYRLEDLSGKDEGRWHAINLKSGRLPIVQRSP